MKQLPVVLVLLALTGAAIGAMQSPAAGPPLTAKELAAALAASPQGDEAIRLADRIRTAFGGRDALLRGLPPKIDELTVAWAVELAEPPPPAGPRPAVVRDVGHMRYAT